MDSRRRNCVMGLEGKNVLLARNEGGRTEARSDHRPSLDAFPDRQAISSIRQIRTSTFF